jgi:hypothetical protein
MLLNTKTNVKRSGMILLIVVAFLSMFLVVGTTYLLVADSIRRTSDFDLNSTDKRSDYALMPDIDPRYMFNFALGQILYDVVDPTFDPTTGKILTTNSALRGHSLARDIYGGYNPAGVNDRPFQGKGKDEAELDVVNYMVFGPTTGVGVRDPEKGVRGNPPVYSRWNPSHTIADKNHYYLGSYSVDNTGNATIIPSYHRDNILIAPASPPNPAVFIGPLNSANPYLTPVNQFKTLRPTNVGFQTPDASSPNGLDVKNLKGFPGGNDSIWIDAGFPVMTTPDGRKYKTLVAPLILDLDSRINLNVAGNLMQRDTTDPTKGSHSSHQGIGRWEINPEKLATGSDIMNYLSFLNQSGAVANGSDKDNKGDWKVYGRFFDSRSLPINPVQGQSTFENSLAHPYAPINFNAATDGPAFSKTANKTMFKNMDPVNPQKLINPIFGFPTFSNTESFGNGDPKIESILPDISTTIDTRKYPYNYSSSGTFKSRNYHARNYNPYRPSFLGNSTYNQNDISSVFPISESAALLNWNSLASDTSKSKLAQLAPNSIGKNNDPLATKIRTMITTLSADLDLSSLVPIEPDSLSPPVRFDYKLSPTFTWLPEKMAPDVIPVAPISKFGQPNITTPALKLNLNRKLTNFPDCVPIDPTTLYGNFYDTTNAAFADALKERQAFAGEIFNHLRSVLGIIKVEDPLLAGRPPTEQKDIKKINLFCAQLAVNIVDYLDYDDVLTPFRWNGKEWVFGTELPRLVINEVYCQAQNKKSEGVFDKSGNAGKKKASEDFDINTFVELYNPLPDAASTYLGNDPDDPIKYKDTSTPPVTSYKLAGSHNAVLQYKNGEKTKDDKGKDIDKEFPNYRIVLAKRNSLSATLSETANYDPTNNTGVNTVWNNTGMTWFNLDASKLDKTTYNPKIEPNEPLYDVAKDLAKYKEIQDPDDPDPAKKVKVRSQIKKWKDSSTLADYKSNWIVAPSMPYVVSDSAQLRPKTDPSITTQFQSPDLDLTSPISDYAGTTAIEAPSVLLQRLAIPGYPRNEIVDPLNGTLQYPNLAPNPFITVDVFSGTTIINNIEAGNDGDPNVAIKYDKDDLISANNFKSVGRNNIFLDSVGGNTVGDMFKLTGSTAVVQQKKIVNNMATYNTMGNTNTENNLANTAQSAPWLVHLDRPLINPLELIYVSCYRPTLLSQMANRWSDTHVQNYKPADANQNYDVSKTVKNVFAHNWPWLDENTRLNRFLESVAVAPLQAGESLNGRVLGKVNINTVSQSEVLSAIADANGYSNFADGDLAALISNRTKVYSPNPANIKPFPFSGFGSAVNADFTVNPLTNLSRKTGLHSSLLGYTSFDSTDPTTQANAETPVNSVLDFGGTPNELQYARKELLTKIGNSVTTRSNVFAVWITTGYFEVIDDTAQPPTLGAEIGKADGINIRHRMFAIVDRTNMVNSQLKDVSFSIPAAPVQNIDFGTPGTLILKSVIPPYNNVPAVAGMLLTFEPNTDNEETISLRINPLNGNLVGDFQKTHPRAGFTKLDIINRGNPGPWVGYDRNKDRDVVPYAEIIE